jgi:ABC-type antimicrobial peptide transport system permease subunit
LFLGFSFFLVVAALLLMALLFQFGIEQRATEVGILLALGFRPKTVRRLLLGEGAALALLGAILGALGGVAYARAMFLGLATIWLGAVGTSALKFHSEPMTIVLGLATGVAVSVLTVWFALRNQAQQPARELLAQSAGMESVGSSPGQRRHFSPWVAGVSAVLAVALLGWAGASHSQAAAGAFFSAGALMLIAGLSGCTASLRVLGRIGSASRLNLRGLGVRNCARRSRRSLATVALLACGVFLIVAVGATRPDPGRDSEQRSSGTGGFALIGEATLPIVQDLNRESGREFFGLDAKSLPGVTFVPLRVHDGDDASCLNLNRAQTPRLLGVQPEQFATRGAFTFAEIAKSLPKENTWRLLNQKTDDGSVPAIGDEASIQWALGKSVGDTVDYTDERGRKFKLRLVGAVANSILQGSLLIAEDQFVARFPSESGYRMFLIDAPSNEVSSITETLARALQDLGLELTPTPRRLAEFDAVENTYLSTFQVLGGLGLLLGSVGLGVGVLRNVLERRGELALLLAVGFQPRALRRLVLSEHGALLLAGLAVGMVAALVAVLPALASPGAQVPYLSLALTLGGVLASGVIWTWLATRLALRGKLLDALRNN